MTSSLYNDARYICEGCTMPFQTENLQEVMLPTDFENLPYRTMKKA